MSIGTPGINAIARPYFAIWRGAETALFLRGSRDQEIDRANGVFKTRKVSEILTLGSIGWNFVNSKVEG